MLGRSLVLGHLKGWLRQVRQGIVAAARRAFRVVKTAAWLVRKCSYYFLPPVLYYLLRAIVLGLMPRVLRHDTRAKLRSAISKRLHPNSTGREGKAKRIVRRAMPVPVGCPDEYASAYHLPERTPADVAAKILGYRNVSHATGLDRVRLLRELARLEELGGNALKGALYRLRAMRLVGRDEFEDLGRVRPVLELNGYGAEATAATALYDQQIDRDTACDRLIRDSLERHRRPALLRDDFEIFEDRRGVVPGRVTVVITLFNAARKLPRFLEALQLQTLNRMGQLELVIVDSASPLEEYTAFRNTQLRFPIPTLFVRTRDRESIQTAWNRALGLVRTPYLSLLGADEAIVPETLDLLSRELDADAGLDWAQGDVMVTQVDPFGTQAADLMAYDRSGFTPEMVYLETCYLGPVGAVHRKSLHDRVGYFDGSFRAAGDTEFKNRVLPFIRVRTVPRMLGLYLDYPEERATASPRAELEDFRAWYLHRTPAGIRYAFEDRPAEDLERFLVKALRYRKSYQRRSSTDFELADTIARVLRERLPGSPALGLAPGIGRVLQALRTLDYMPSTRAKAWSRTVTKALATIKAVETEHKTSGRVPKADYEVFRDNRYEQHQTFW